MGGLGPWAPCPPKFGPVSYNFAKIAIAYIIDKKCTRAFDVGLIKLQYYKTSTARLKLKRDLFKSQTHSAVFITNSCRLL